MTSFQTSISPSRREAARYVTHVRRTLQAALVEEEAKRGLTQSDIARIVGVHRSVINRELRGYKDITHGRVAELAYALGRTPTFSLPEAKPAAGSNVPVSTPASANSASIVMSSSASKQFSVTVSSTAHAVAA